MHMASVHTRQVFNLAYVKLHRTKVEPLFTSIVYIGCSYPGGCPLTSSSQCTHVAANLRVWVCSFKITLKIPGEKSAVGTRYNAQLSDKKSRVSP